MVDDHDPPPPPGSVVLFVPNEIADKFVGDPFRKWLQETPGAVSPKAHWFEHEVRLTFPDALQATLFKLRWF